MAPRLFALTLLLAALSPAIATEESIANFLCAQAEELELHKDPTWRKLLHFKPGKSRSEVISREFFLSPNGHRDPSEELDATVRAYFENAGAIDDDHARCRFPARYFWLSRHLAFPDYDSVSERCESFQRWALPDKVDSVSLYLVSGYFGNPASTFGHALLKLNTGSDDDQLGLFDLTINYGALVPENEPTAVYVFRGLFGGYQAGFSDQYFYTQDQVYSRTEFRDIWDFKLNLDQRQRTFLLLHLWEIIGKKFTYYFLKENCAYRLTELVDLVVEEDVLVNARAWYAPVQLFHRLRQIDKSRRAKGQQGIISSISPIPSARRLLYQQFAQLEGRTLGLANELIGAGAQADLSRIGHFSEAEQLDLLDALLAYHQYKQVAEEPDPSPERLRAKDRILLERLTLPARDRELESPEIPIRPTATNRPVLTLAGWAADQNGDQHARFKWSGFSQGPLSHSLVEGGELTVLAASTSFDGDGLKLDQLDVVKVQKLNIAPVRIAGESRLSWQGNLGMNRELEELNDRSDWHGTFGVGRAWALNRTCKAFAMLNGSWHSAAPDFRAAPEVGAHALFGSLYAKLSAAYEIGDGLERDLWSLEVQYKLSPQRAIRFEFGNTYAIRTALSAVFYW